MLGTAAAAVGTHFDLTQAFAQGTNVLRIAMTAADVPLPNGQTDQGAEGLRFIGFTLFEPLIAWDLSSADKASGLMPALATSWSTDKANTSVWTFKLRDGVKFHDGSTFDASAVVWNFEKILNKDAPQFDPRQAGQGRGRIPSIKSYRAIDPMTVEITTNIPDALLPYGLTFIVMSSPKRWEDLGKSWDKFLSQPSGTGPFKLDKYVPRERAELVRNDAYWNKARMAKSDRVVLLPMPEATSRTAALLAGQVDWIESPAPDSVPQIKSRGFKVVTNVYPHNWTWHFSRVEGSPWNDIRVRKAANLAIDRDGMVQLLGGLMVPAKGMVPPNSPWFGKPTFDVKYDPKAAVALLAEAGFSKSKPIEVKAIISPAGSGQMQPMAMNEAIQQMLGDVGIKVSFEVMEWNALVASWRAGAKDPTSRGAHSTNSSYFSQDPFTCLIRHLDSSLVAPKGTNWGYYADAEMDKLFAGILNTFEVEAQLPVIQKAHEKFVNEALFLFVAHDVNPRAMSSKVQGFVQAQNWYQDIAPVSVGS
ncbi:MAG: ABC transporter substrate-binding protein [Hyphomicrobiaceae bacterium]|nr:ABC transporter substrate-binding protein [Hyphomicrobiaceae bacterium]